MRYLDLGCGYRFHPDWTNVDFFATGPNVVAHNLTKGIPFADTSFDVVYHSHFLEHLTKSQAPILLRECYRVLRPQGIIRIAVPDLEQIVRGYLLALEQVLSGSREAADNYNWLLLELLDQTVRTQSGGEMAAYLQQEHIPNEAFVLKRRGTDARVRIAAGQRRKPTTPRPDSWLLRTLRPAYRFLRHSDHRREVALKRLLGSTDYEALQTGRFRRKGEVHQWMYDRYSMQRLLEQCGFVDVVRRDATESYIPNWASFGLDAEPDGSVYMPVSLFMEARRSLNENCGAVPIS